MKNRLLAFALSTVMILSLTACGKARPVINETPTTMPQAATETQAPAKSVSTTATPVPVTPAAEPSRQDGERFDSVIMLEGMEEPVHYEHLVNQSAGFEMDYDYDFFKRKSEADGESFFSVWDDEKVPENYLEVRHEAKNAQAAADAVSETLSREFEIYRGPFEHGRIGDCIYIEASQIKNTDQMPEHLQAVYIIPASDGCIVATAHCYIAESEGFFRRFSYMVKTISPLGN
jgi:hypothetical protein